MFEVVVCDLAGVPQDAVELSTFSATSSLTSPGEATFTVRASESLYEYLTPWGGMLVLLNGNGDVLWSGVPVKRRGAVGEGQYEIAAKEWTHWLERVAPGKLEDAPYQDYDGATVGYIVNDLMGLIPQTELGFVPSPLQPPATSSGSTVVLGEPQETIDRGTVWDTLAPLRDQGIEMRAVTTWESDAYVPRMIVGDPKVGNTTSVGLWLGANVANVQIEEDGDLMATRWRVKGAGEALEKFGTGTGLLLLDNVKDYGDNFATFLDPAQDELTELTTRADALLANSKTAPLAFSDVEVIPGFLLSPGDTVTISTPPQLQDVRLSGGYETSARVESAQFEADKTTVSLVSPESSADTLPVRPTFFRQLRDVSSALALLKLKV